MIKKMIKKIAALLMVLTVCCASLPIRAFALVGKSGGVKAQGESENESSLGYIELNDGYISVRVSSKNAGYYVSTVEGDVISKTDNNADLVYSDSQFDTSFTSFRVTRDGKVQDYIFGRDYTHLGIDTSDVSVYRSADNAVVAEWTVDGILFTQTIALMGADTYQHGMVYIAYSATNTSDKPVDSIKARVMLDTALGTTDYAYYMLAQKDGSYTAIEEEKTVSGSDYYNYFFAYDDKESPRVTAYTLNASVEGESVIPERVTFAHWYNLASNVFDYSPSESDPLKFTELYGDREYLTQDSAVAMYYDMGSSIGKAESSTIALYHGVYSNYNAGDADVALNFTSSGTMFFNDDETAYKDLNGELPGNFSVTFKIQNIADNDISKLAVAIYPEEEVYPHNGYSFVEDYSVNDPYYKEITELKVGEVNDVRFDFRVEPTYATGYRRIKVVIYNTSAQSTFSDDNIVLEDDFYILCPGSQSTEVGFTGMTPSSVFVKGTRYAYITGTNFGLIRDKSQYRIVLRPRNGGDDVVLDQDKVVVNTELNTATLILDMELEPTTYDVVIDWNDVTIEDMTSDALKLIVTDVPQKGDPGYISSGVYGIAAIIRNGTHYDIVNYSSEEEYLSLKPADKDVMLVMRGSFNFLSSEQKGNFQAEAITLLDGDTIIINDTLEVRSGRVTVTKNFEGDVQTGISVDIDGKVYTTKANIKIWDGVLAITSFDEGELYTLPVYSVNGEKSFADGEENAETITLLWPGAAGKAQTLAGLLLNLNYGEFALMEQGDELARVISFGASLDSSILVPSGRFGTDRHYSNLEKKQLEMGVSAYTAEQLRATDLQFRKDQAEWRNEQSGTLNLYMDDILFGSGGFIGFNTEIEVGIPSYTDGLPYVEGTLALKVINDYWEFSVEGEADMMLFTMEASLSFKSYNSIPVPDSFYFFIGGVNPGIPVDPFGVFWVRGAGAGIGEIYETFFGRSTVPPLTLMVSGEFAIFSVLSARADISLSAQGFSGYLNDVEAAGITIIDRIGGSIYWYPEFSLAFGIRIDIFDAIVGEGSIVVKEEDDGGYYFGGYASATVKIPDSIWFIGGTTIGQAAIGIDTQKIWGSVKVIGIGVGLVYYWGGSLDISTGKNIQTPEPISEFSIDTDAAAVPVYHDAKTGRTLYMSLNSRIKALSAKAGEGEDLIVSSSDKMKHQITLGAKSNEDILLTVSYSADNAYMAEDIKNAMKIAFANGDDYTLEWFDTDYDADSEANSGTNALFRYDESTKTATVSVSFTDTARYGQTATVTLSAASDVKMYAITKSVVFDGVTMNEAWNGVTVTGSGLEKLSRISIYAADGSGSVYPLAKDVEITGDVSASVIIAVSIPQNLPSGEYKLQAVGTVLDDEGNESQSPMTECDFSYVNPEQPTSPVYAKAELGGNYTLSLNARSGGEYDGFIINIYEVANGSYTETVFKDIVTEFTDEMKQSETKTLTLGGRNASVDDSGVTTYIGLEAGGQYAVSVQNYKTMPDGSRLMSTPVVTDSVMMVMPTKTTPTFSIDGSVSLKLGSTSVSVDTVNTDTFTVKVSGVDKITSATYTLGDGEAVQWDGKDITLTGISDGTYTLYVEGINATKDSFTGMYQFAVDTEAPSMLISSPQGGGFFSGGSTVVTGITEAGARIEITVGDGLPTVGYADGAGAFEIEVALDESYAYQDIQVFAYDGMNNQSMPFGCTLTNELLGDPDLKAVILVDGSEVSSIVCTSEAKQLAMAFKSGDKYITVNRGSSAESRIEWHVQAIEKQATISSDGVLSGDDGAKGVVTVNLDSKTAMVEMAAVDLAQIDVTVVIPDGGYVYNGSEKKPQIVFESDELLTEGEDYTVMYINNISAGVASVVLTATEDGKCVGTRIVNFDIAPRDISLAELSVSFDDPSSPVITVKYGETVLAPDSDYTAELTWNSNKTAAIVNIFGTGNYSGFISQKFDPENSQPVEDTTEGTTEGATEDSTDGDMGTGKRGFNHLIWILPTSAVVVGGLVFGGYMVSKFILKKRKNEEK